MGSWVLYYYFFLYNFCSCVVFWRKMTWPARQKLSRIGQVGTLIQHDLFSYVKKGAETAAVPTSSRFVCCCSWMGRSIWWLLFFFQLVNIYWLVVWNIFFIFPYIGHNHPNWRSYFSEAWPNRQPVYQGKLGWVETYPLVFWYLRLLMFVLIGL